MTDYLALDLGTRTGVANNVERLISSWSWNLAPPRGVPGYGARFRQFINCLDSQYAIFQPEHILYEEVRAHKGTRAAHIYGGFLAVLATWAEKHSIPMTGVGVGTIKRRITGKGNASKQEVMEACKERGCNPKTYDEADALALLIGVLETETTR